MSTDRRRSNPSSILYWADLRNDPKLRRCSPAAKGLWAVHMLPAAAESPEYGVIILDGLPSLQQDLGELFSREIGESPEVGQELVDELVRMGAASVDDRGRVYCRRMVREEGLRKKRSAAGKLGAAAKHGKHSGKATGKLSGKQVGKQSGKPHGKQGGKDHGTPAGKIESDDIALNAGRPSTNGHAEGEPAWQTDGISGGKALPSSHPSLSSRPSHPSHEENLVPRGTCDETDLVAAFDAWDAAAERVGRWPKLRKRDADRRKRLRSRLNDCGTLAEFTATLAKAEASHFCREKMNGFCFDWFVTAANFRKVSEGNYDDDRQGAAAAPGHVDALRDVVGAFRRKEQSPGWN